MKTTKKPARVHKSRGNVFADLGVRKPEEMLAKAQLAHRVCEIIAGRGLTQTKAAQLMRLDQPKISALMRGKLRGFSADRLFRCLHYLGQEVEIVVRPVKQAGSNVAAAAKAALPPAPLRVQSSGRR